MKLLYYLLGLTNTFVFHEECKQLMWSVRDFKDSIDNLDFVKIFARTNGLVEGSDKKPELTYKGEEVIAHLYHKLFYVESPRSWMMGKMLRINKQQEIDYNNQKKHFRLYVANCFSVLYYIIPTILATIMATLICISICR